jgi:hypothetical protein
MAENFLIVGLSLSLALNFLICPLVLWLGWKGVTLKIWKWKMRSGKWDSSLFFDKNNNIRINFEERDGSKIRINKGLYVSTPEPSRLYRFMGIPVRLRRENDPEDLDIWERENATNTTAKELDNVVNEAISGGLAEILKQYFPVVLVVVGLLLIFALGALYMNYTVFNAIQGTGAVIDLIPK